MDDADPVSRQGGPRAPGACDPCKLSKVKCVFPVPGAKCRRCEHAGHDCRISGRKQKPRPPSHDELVDRLREKEQVILHLLMGPSFAADAASSPDSIPSPRSTPPLPPLPVWDKRTPRDEVQRRVAVWIADARRRVGTAPDDDDHPPPAVLPDAPDPPPDIVRAGIVTPGEVDALFCIFFDKINMFFTICDPVLHTPARVRRASPFLFTTICAVASRHYAPRPTLYPTLLHAAKHAAAAALHGPKAVESCQAYLLLGVYHPPPRTFLEDRTFLFLGLAIRMATDLELHRPQHAPPDAPEAAQRAALNRARVWLNCFCNDRSISTQLGKPSAIRRGTAALPLDLARWWRASPYSGPHDIHLCAYGSLLQAVSAFHDAVPDLGGAARQPLDLRMVQRHADRIAEVSAEWARRLAENSARRPHPATTWRDNLWPFLVSYARLVVLSIGLQDGMRQGLRHDNPFADQCVDAATALLTHVTDTLAHLGYLRYCPEAHFVFMGFAAAFLLKILRPKFAFMMRPGRAAAIAARVRALVALLGSDATAVDARHTPRLYARFLASVLARYTGDEDEAAAAAAPAPMDGVGADEMLHSMAAITDPGFWEHGMVPMPGFNAWAAGVAGAGAGAAEWAPLPLPAGVEWAAAAAGGGAECAGAGAGGGAEWAPPGAEWAAPGAAFDAQAPPGAMPGVVGGGGGGAC